MNNEWGVKRRMNKRMKIAGLRLTGEIFGLIEEWNLGVINE